MLYIILIPLFPFQVFLIKTLTLLTNGKELKKISRILTEQEATFESQASFILQLYIIFNRADRLPSTTQLLAVSSSILFMAKSRVEGRFANEPHAKLLKKIKYLPKSLCFIVYCSGAWAILTSILQAYVLMAFLLFATLTVVYASCLGILDCLFSSRKNMFFKKIESLGKSVYKAG